LEKTVPCKNEHDIKAAKTKLCINGFGFQGFAAFCDYIYTQTQTVKEWL